MKLIRLIGAIVVLQLSLLAQSHITSGLIEGTVRDETSAVIPDVVIGLAHLGIGISRTAKTSTQGFFTLPLLPVGSYELSARRTGFAVVKKTGITVAIGQTRFTSGMALWSQNIRVGLRKKRSEVAGDGNSKLARDEWECLGLGNDSAAGPYRFCDHRLHDCAHDVRTSWSRKIDSVLDRTI